MWKRFVLNLAFTYLERIFDKWIAKKSDASRNGIYQYLEELEKFIRMMKKQTKTTLLVADLINRLRT